MWKRTYRPGSVLSMNGSLAELQELIRSRYLISYKAASFQRDGHYRPIEITAENKGHKLARDRSKKPGAPPLPS